MILCFTCFCNEAYLWWCTQKESWRSLFIIAIWYLRKWRNAKIFQDSKVPLRSTMFQINSSHDVLPNRAHGSDNLSKQVGNEPLFSYPAAFFDGAEQSKRCGCGVHIILDDKMQYHLSWSGGRGTNNLAEARALAGLLAFCSFLEIQDISIYGDSKIMVDHIRGSCHIDYPHLS